VKKQKKVQPRNYSFKKETDDIKESQMGTLELKCITVNFLKASERSEGKDGRDGGKAL
jgi:hypothetical protein